MNVQITVDFTMETCISCGCNFWMPTDMNRQLRQNKNSFYCPSGHSMAYTKSEADRLKEQLHAKEKELAHQAERLRQLSQVKRRAVRKAS